MFFNNVICYEYNTKDKARAAVIAKKNTLKKKIFVLCGLHYVNYKLNYLNVYIYTE